MERRKASDFPPEVLKLFDGYVHGWLSRRDFLDKAGKYAVGGFSAAAVGMSKLAGTGVLYAGLESVGGGSVLAGMVLGAMAVFIIETQMRRAAMWAFAGAILAYVGLIHGAQLGWAVSPMVALGYALFGVTCLVLSRGQADAPTRT